MGGGRGKALGKAGARLRSGFFVGWARQGNTINGLFHCMVQWCEGERVAELAKNWRFAFFRGRRSEKPMFAGV